MINLKKLAISIPLSLMAIFFSKNVIAYSFTNDFQNGYYWKTFPISMSRFVVSDTDTSNLQRLADEAVEEWESAIGQDVWTLNDVVKTSNYSGNYIRWSDNFGAETGYDPNSTLAVTIRYNKGTFFERVVIILNGNISYLRQNWGNALKTTLLHEIGHTVGLDHSKETNSIMYPTLGSTYVLQNDDIQGMSQLIAETQRRQQIGYVSPYSASSDSKKIIPACGTIEDVGDKENKTRIGNFIGALLFGFLISRVLRKFNLKNKTVFVRY